MENRRLSVTRCPKCQTPFRVTRSQLRAAGGSVRCGSCLNVFNALEDNPSTDIDSINAKKKLNTSVNNEQARILPEKQEGKQTATQSTPSSITKESTSKQPLNTLLNALDKDQVDAHQAKQRKKANKKRLWKTVAILTASLLLMVQYIAFNKDELSLNPKYRAYYELACQTFNCTLPPLVNVNQIQSSQLLVRVNPDNPEMIIVDAVIVNKANHPQPWPKLSLSFANLQDQPVAGRILSPKDYLGGELTGSKEMPANKAIRLSLELLNPGSDAVNYRLTFK